MTKITRALCLAAAPILLPTVVGAQPAGDATRTRAELNDVLRRYPPSLGSVLSLDPSLLTNPSYLAPYPDVAGVLVRHPEIVRNPGFYLPPEGRERTVVVRTSGPGDLSALLAVAVFVGVGVWLVRTIVDYRRWNRLTKIQTDAHTKILDRFTENADLLAYIQSDAGKRFLESSPIMLDSSPSAIAAPLGRILWSVQAGIVLMAAGMGIVLVSARFTGPADRPFRIFGGLAIALGIGFILSAGASYLISRKLGLIESQSASAPAAE